MSEGHIPLHKALFSFVLRWKLKKLLKIECASKAFVKLLAVTDRNAASSGAATHNHTSRKQYQHWAVVLVSSLTDRCFSPDCLELVCLWKACVHILPTWLGDWEILPWKRGTVARGQGRLGAQHSWASVFTVQPVLQLEFWNFGNMFLKSLSTYNLYKKIF